MAALTVGSPAVTPRLSATEATQRRQHGLPLVTPRELDLDWDTFAALFQQVCRITAKHRSDVAETVDSLAAIANHQPKKIRGWIGQMLVEGQPGKDDETGLRAFCLTHTLRPFLRRHAQAYAGLVDGQGWRRGYCPICGGAPDLAALSSEEEGARHLLCCRCDNEWRFKRIGCPFCGTDDHRQLSYYPEEEGPGRLSVCDHCKRYLKTIDLRIAPDRPLPVYRVTTLPMDLAAREQGYQ